MNASESLLVIDGLTISYRSRRRTTTAVSQLSLHVGRGEIVALVGESGSGKSSTAHAVLGLLGDEAVVTANALRFEGRKLQGLSTRGWRRILGSGIALVPQDPAVSLDPVQRVRAQITETLRTHRVVPRQLERQHVHELLTRVGIDQPELRAEQYPHQLSGGQRQRVLIAMALAAGPRLLVADEPTSALDVTVQKEILDELDRIVREDGISVLLITHDLGVASERAHRVVVLRSGSAVESGTPLEVFQRPTADYTRELIGAVPSLRARPDRPAPSARVTPILEGCGVSKSFDLGGRTAGQVIRAVDAIDISLLPGATTAVVGESGSGKSTLARILTGLETPDTGAVLLDGEPIDVATTTDRRRIARQVQFVYQNPYSSLNPVFTVEEIVTEPLLVHERLGRAARARRASELIDAVALPADVLGRNPVELSGGQRQRVAIARALSVRPRVVVLDEPVSALDVSVQAVVLDLLIELQRELSLSYLFISHDLGVVDYLSDAVYVMQRGQVVEKGASHEVLTHPSHPYTRRLVASIPRPEFAGDGILRAT